MRTIAVANQKGGCGKTTTAINLAVALAQMGQRVLIVDLDPQACTTSALNGEPDATRPTVYHLLVNSQIPMSEVVVRTNVERLDLAPSNVSLAAAEIELIGEPARELRLAGAFRTVRDDYDFCVIDCPPSLGVLTLNALVASTDVIVPVQADSYALECARRLLETVEIIRRRFHRLSAGNLRILLTCVDDRVVLGRRVQQQMRELFGDLVLHTVIHRTAILPEALAAGKAAMTYAPTSTGAVEYMKLARELVTGEFLPQEDTTLRQAAQAAEKAATAQKLAAAQASAAPATPIAEQAGEKPQAVADRTRTPRKRKTAAPPATAVEQPPVSPPQAAQESRLPDLVPAAGETKCEPVVPARRHRVTVLIVLLLVIVAAAAGVTAWMKVNRAPVAHPANMTTQEDTPVSVSLAGTDWNRDRLTYRIAEGPLHGQLSGKAPDVIYTPAPDYHGLDKFTFTVSDGKADSQAATVSISIAAVNDAPVAAAQSATVEDTKSLVITLVGSDADGDRLSFAIGDHAGHGALDFDAKSVADGNVMYTPDPGFVGTDSFTFKVSDGVAESAPATVSVKVIHVNVAPTADRVSVTAKEDTPLPIVLTGTDPESDPLTYSIVEGPAHGSLGGAAPEVIYTPEPNYNGPDQFSFVVNDGKLDSSPAIVSISIDPTNDAPVANAQDAAVQDKESLPLTLAGSDVDGDDLMFRIAEQPVHGTLDLDSQFAVDGKLVYTPQAGFVGPDSFTFQTSDGSADSAPAVVSLNVIHVNVPPEANDVEVTTPEDTPLSVALAARDPEGSPLTYTVTSGPSNGTLAGVMPDLEYVPKADFHGTDVFSYLVSDGQGGTATATVTIQVTSVNDAPSITSEPPTMAAVGRSYAYDVNAMDPDAGDKLTYSLVENPAGMTIDPVSGLVRWTPTSDQLGNHEVTVQVADSAMPAASNTQVFPISVEIPSPHKMTIAAAGGYDQSTGKALTAEEGIHQVQAADSEWWQTQAGRYTVYSFAKAPIPAGAAITSVVLYIDHFEDAQFPSGKLEWRIGMGWPKAGASWLSLNPSIYEGQRNKGALAWVVTTTVNTPEKVNALQVQVKNTCTSGQKATFVDHIYLQVQWQ
jgi:cellulose biosynthesis protein BcsQ